MIAPGTELHIVVVRLSQIVVTECQPRYLSRVAHYVQLLSDPAHEGHHAGVVHLAPYGVNSATHEPLYTLLDGHHRYCAAILCGRQTLLGVLHIAPPAREPIERGQTTPVATVREATNPRLTRALDASDDDFETLALLPAVTSEGVDEGMAHGCVR